MMLLALDILKWDYSQNYPQRLWINYNCLITKALENIVYNDGYAKTCICSIRCTHKSIV
jgi:hypothetical protein